MGRGYYESAKRRLGSSSFSAYQRLPPRKPETEKERAERKEHERRAAERQEAEMAKEHRAKRSMEHERPHEYRREPRDPYVTEKKSGEDSHKRRSRDDPGKGPEGRDPKKAKITEKSSSSAQPPPEIPDLTVDLGGAVTAVSSAQMRSIIQKKPYTLDPGPPKLQAQFPEWYLKGVRFDLDLPPFDKNAIYANLDAVRREVDRMGNWPKLVDELQYVNKANMQAMVTYELEKATWDETLKARDLEIENLTNFGEDLQEKNQRLEEELATKEARWASEKELMNEQVKSAYSAQKNAEDKLAIEHQSLVDARKQTEEVLQRNAETTLENTELKLEVERLRRERNEALAGKAAAEAEKLKAEQAHEETRAGFDETVFNIYTQLTMYKGSLRFLGEDYEHTLVEVWQSVLNQLLPQGYTDEELQDFMLSEEDREALARGREQLVIPSSVGTSGAGVLDKGKAIADPVPDIPSTAATTAVDPAPATTANAPLPGDTTQAAAERDSSGESDPTQYEVELRKNLEPSGKTGPEPIPTD